MAVIDQLPGISVSILVQDKIANEYSAPPGFSAHQKDEGVPFVARSIEARTGSSYTIAAEISQALNFLSGANGLALDVYIDGQQFTSRLIHKDNFNDSGLSSVIKSRAEGGPHQAMPIFSDIRTIEEADKATVEKDIERVKKMGTIEVHLEFIDGAEIDKDATEFAPQDYASLDVAHKAMIKSGQAVSHGTSHKTIPSDEVIGCQEGHDIAKAGVFYFYYISKHLIEKQHILPAPRTPMDIKEEHVAANDPLYRTRELPNGKIEIDLTGED